MRYFGLLGYPLSHSFSQQFFTDKFIAEGITDCVYENFSVPAIVAFKTILANQPALEGFNITIPYKREIVALLDSVTDSVRKMGACNCVKITNGKLVGYNTDIVGFKQSLLPYLKSYHQQALILGTGGASSAVAYVLNELSIPYQFVSRLATASAISYDSLNANILQTHKLIINTTPLGMYPNVQDFPAVPFHLLTPKHHLFDLIYNPSETKFLAQGKMMGASIQNGLEMLVLQAEESWRIWNDSNR
jgi:shikimate dehydrogenase